METVWGMCQGRGGGTLLCGLNRDVWLNKVSCRGFLGQMTGFAPAVNPNQAPKAKQNGASEAFVNTVEGALANAEVQFLNNGGDNEKMRHALQEVRSLLRPIAVRHFDTRRGF